MMFHSIKIVVGIVILTCTLFGCTCNDMSDTITLTFTKKGDEYVATETLANFAKPECELLSVTIVDKSGAGINSIRLTAPDHDGDYSACSLYYQSVKGGYGRYLGGFFIKEGNTYTAKNQEQLVVLSDGRKSRTECPVVSVTGNWILTIHSASSIREREFTIKFEYR